MLGRIPGRDHLEVGRGIHMATIAVWRQEDSFNWVVVLSMKRIMR